MMKAPIRFEVDLGTQDQEPHSKDQEPNPKIQKLAGGDLAQGFDFWELVLGISGGHS
jgi:hypothetical protein